MAVRPEAVAIVEMSYEAQKAYSSIRIDLYS